MCTLETHQRMRRLDGVMACARCLTDQRVWLTEQLLQMYESWMRQPQHKAARDAASWRLWQLVTRQGPECELALLRFTELLSVGFAGGPGSTVSAHLGVGRRLYGSVTGADARYAASVFAHSFRSFRLC